VTPPCSRAFEEFIGDFKVGAVVLDSASTFFASMIDLSSTKAGSVVNLLTPVADRTGATVIIHGTRRRTRPGLVISMPVWAL
jgi:hypothetical protein